MNYFFIRDCFFSYVYEIIATIQLNKYNNNNNKIFMKTPTLVFDVFDVFLEYLKRN